MRARARARITWEMYSLPMFKWIHSNICIWYLSLTLRKCERDLSLGNCINILLNRWKCLLDTIKADLFIPKFSNGILDARFECYRNGITIYVNEHTEYRAGTCRFAVDAIAVAHIHLARFTCSYLAAALVAVCMNMQNFIVYVDFPRRSISIINL